MTQQETALNGIGAAIAVLRAVRNKLEAVIARKKVAGDDVDEERAERAEVNRRLANMRDLEAEIEAASSVVSAPTPGEIAETRKLLKKVEELAMQDAMTEAGLDFLLEAVAAARRTGSKVKA